MLLLASPAALQVPILLQTDRYAVVAKPPGMVVHRNKFVPRESVPLLQGVRDQLGRYVNAVHRLDGGTSGCVVFAYDSETTAMLQAAMTSGAASKTYYAFVRGDASRLRDHLEERELKDDKGVVKEARKWLDCVAAHFWWLGCWWLALSRRIPLRLGLKRSYLARRWFTPSRRDSSELL